MAHIIQPIAIDGGVYCCKCYGVSDFLGRGTKGVMTTDYATSGNSAAITTDCGPWLIFTGSADSSDGEISFGVSCGTTVTITINSSINSGTEYGVDVVFYVDTVDIGVGVFVHETGASDTVSLTVTGGPCGTIITAVSNSLAADTAYDVDVTMEVSSIT